jgi:hypothetical protein
MLNIDENDPFFGSPKSKFFDVIQNANRGIVESVVEEFLDRYAAMEILLAKAHKPEEIEAEIENTIQNNQDEIYEAKNDIYINLVGDVLTQHE